MSATDETTSSRALEGEIEALVRSQIGYPEAAAPLIVTWPERISRVLRIRHHLIFWVLLPEIIFFGQYLLVVLTDSNANGMYAFAVYLGLLGYMTVLIPFNARKVESLLPAVLSFVNQNEDKTRAWFDKQVLSLFSAKSDSYAFLFFGPALTGTLVYVTDFFQQKTPWFGNRVSDWYALTTFVLFSFVGGHYVRFVMHLGMFVKRLAQLPVRLTIYQHPATSIRALGKVMFIIALNGAGFLILAYIGIFVSPIPVNWMTVCWMGVAGALLLCLFVVPQFEIHRLMADMKHRKIWLFSKHLESAMNSAVENPTNENIDRFEKLSMIQERLINGMHVWPFDFKTLLTLLSAIVIPILVAIIQILFK